MKNKKRYADRLLNQVLNTEENEFTTLQLSINVSKREKENLEAFVNILKENGKKASIKSVCYEALKEAGVFDNIRTDKNE